jgi:flagellar assembly factor FliW
MIINTKNFGEVEFEEKDKIFFQKGLLGFEDKKEFLLLNNYDTEDPVPFMWLQSVDDEELSFVVSIPFFLRTDYEVEITDDICNQLNIHDPNEVGIYSICKIENDVKDMTVNFQSPLIINAQTKNGMQIVMYDSNYQVDEKVIPNK